MSYPPTAFDQENGYGWTFTEREGRLAKTRLRALARSLGLYVATP